MNFKWNIAQWLELKWWKHYISRKSKLDYVSWKKAYWDNLIQKINLYQDIHTALKIADLGCGPFGLALANEEWKKKLTAVDPLLDSYEKELSFFSKIDYPYTYFVNQKMEDFRSENTFDLVFCLNAINHVADINIAFEVLKQSCATNGKVILGIDAHNFNFLKHLFRLVPGDALHPHQYSLEEYVAFLEKRGFTITSTHQIKKELIFDYWVLIAENVGVV